MKRVEKLRRMGLDWAADLIEALQRDKAELKSENEASEDADLPINEFPTVGVAA